jgi:hypothetical protein
MSAPIWRGGHEAEGEDAAEGMGCGGDRGQPLRSVERADPRRRLLHCCGQRRAVGHKGKAQAGGQNLRQRLMRGAAIDDHHLPRPDQPGRGAGQRQLCFGMHRGTGEKGPVGGRGRQRPTMHPDQPPLAGKLAQVAADRVFRNAKFGCQIRGDQPAVAGQPVQQKYLSIFGQHCTNLHDICTILRESSGYASYTVQYREGTCR